jgi:hypothetical protein
LLPGFQGEVRGLGRFDCGEPHANSAELFLVLLEIIYFQVFALGDVERRVFSSNLKYLFLGFQGEVRGLGRCDRGGLYAQLFLVLLEIIYFEAFVLGDVERRVFSSNFKVFIFRFSRPSSWAGTM